MGITFTQNNEHEILRINLIKHMEELYTEKVQNDAKRNENLTNVDI